MAALSTRCSAIYRRSRGRGQGSDPISVVIRVLQRMIRPVRGVKTADIPYEIRGVDKFFNPVGRFCFGLSGENLMPVIDVDNLRSAATGREKQFVASGRRASLNGRSTPCSEGFEMTAQRKEYEAEIRSTGTSLFDGDATEMFSSGAAPVSGADAMSGDATALFSSGAAPVACAEIAAGDEVGLFSSGAAPAMEARTLGGDLVEMFSSGAAPTAGGKVTAGEGAEMFSSGAAPAARSSGS